MCCCQKSYNSNVLIIVNIYELNFISKWLYGHKNINKECLLLGGTSRLSLVLVTSSQKIDHLLFSPEAS